MGLETDVNFIEDLNPAWPVGNDPQTEGDNHIQHVKRAVQGSFPNSTGANNIGAPLTVGAPQNSNQAAQLNDVIQLSNSLNYELDNDELMGMVAADGTVQHPLTAAVTVLAEGAGDYLLTFSTAADTINAQALMVTPGGNTEPDVSQKILTAYAYAVSTTQWRVGFRNYTGTGIDVGFTFIRKAYAP